MSRFKNILCTFPWIHDDNIFGGVSCARFWHPWISRCNVAVCYKAYHHLVMLWCIERFLCYIYMLVLCFPSALISCLYTYMHNAWSHNCICSPAGKTRLKPYKIEVWMMMMMMMMAVVVMTMVMMMMTAAATMMRDNDDLYSSIFWIN